MPVPGGPLTRHGLSLQLYAEEHDVFASAHDFGDCAHRVGRCDMTLEWIRCWSQEYFYLFSQLCFSNVWMLMQYVRVRSLCSRSVYSTAGTYSKVSERVRLWLEEQYYERKMRYSVQRSMNGSITTVGSRTSEKARPAGYRRNHHTKVKNQKTRMIKMMYHNHRHP